MNTDHTALTPRIGTWQEVVPPTPVQEQFPTAVHVRCFYSPATDLNVITALTTLEGFAGMEDLVYIARRGTRQPRAAEVQLVAQQFQLRGFDDLGRINNMRVLARAFRLGNRNE